MKISSTQAGELYFEFLNTRLGAYLNQTLSVTVGPRVRSVLQQEISIRLRKLYD